MCCLDLHRPAAYNQLQSLAKSNDLDFFAYDYESHKENLFKILEDVDVYAKQHNYDVVILDTAGRLSIDEALMGELSNIHKKVSPKEVLLVIDSASGQIALDVAKSFNERVSLSGIIASKVDADSRGGAIISCKYITNIPIKFMGMGEKIHNLEIFNAKKIVDRVLSQGDILTLVEKFDEIEETEVERLKQNLEKGIFSLDDLKKQILQMKKLGGITSIIGMIPGMSDKLGDTQLAEKAIKKQVAIIDSMTKKEKMHPKILNFSRKKRIAKGSGTELSDINKLLKQYEQMAKMVKQLKSGGGGMMNMMKQLKNMGGGQDIQDMFKKLK
jgi:signal recognition particle subunit SRP54